MRVATSLSGVVRVRTFRYITIFLASVNIIGELYRSWGDGRNIVWVLDDVLAGIFLIVAAMLFTRDTKARRAGFAAAWGVGLGMIYGSFFSSLFDGADFNSGNLDWQFLLAVKAFIFLLCIFGVYAAIFWPYEKDKLHE